METLNKIFQSSKIVSIGGFLIMCLLAFILGIFSIGFVNRSTVPENLIKSAMYAVLEEELTSINGTFSSLNGRIEKLEDTVVEIPDFSVDLMKWHLNKLEDKSEVEPMVELWISQGWGAQIVSMKRIAINEFAEKELSENIANKEIFEEFIIVIKRIYN